MTQHCKFSIFTRKRYDYPWWWVFRKQKEMVTPVECWVYGYGVSYPLDLMIDQLVMVQYTGKDSYLYNYMAIVTDINHNLAKLVFFGGKIADPDTREPVNIKVVG